MFWGSVALAKGTLAVINKENVNVGERTLTCEAEDACSDVTV